MMMLKVKMKKAHEMSCEKMGKRKKQVDEQQFNRTRSVDRPRRVTFTHKSTVTMSIG